MFSLRDFGVFVPFVFLLMVQSGHGSEIIGGKEVKAHSLPFMALLQAKGPVCGGILIDPKWVLTAAHCDDIKTVMLGVHNIRKKEKGSWQVLNVKERFEHPHYDKTNNDIMLLKLDKPAKRTKTVKCLKLGKSIKDPAAGSKCLVAGWGATKNANKTMSDVLMSAYVTVIDRVKCNSRNYYNNDPPITKSMICAGSDGKNSADTCQGDSGGPLLCNKAVVGVTSSGKGCGLPKKPGVYSFLTEEHLTWIKKKMGGM